MVGGCRWVGGWMGGCCNVGCAGSAGRCLEWGIAPGGGWLPEGRTLSCPPPHPAMQLLTWRLPWGDVGGNPWQVRGMRVWAYEGDGGRQFSPGCSSGWRLSARNAHHSVLLPLLPCSWRLA